ncbi:MAG: hypothetical protein HOP11_04630 [Saprospiraceae bacterium]|nr:hypothetical protein [Saprospiraceae bacterium]
MNWKFILCSLSCNFIFGQENNWMSSLLCSSFSDPKVLQNIELVRAAENIKFQSPWIRSINARIGISGAALGDTIYGYLRNEDNYAIFIEPNSLLEIKRQKKLKDAKLELYRSEYDEILQSALDERYDLLLDHMWISIWSKHYKELDSLLHVKKDFLKKAIELNQKFDLQDLLRNDKELHESEKNRNKIFQSQKNCTDKINGYVQGQSVNPIYEEQLLKVKEIEDEVLGLAISNRTKNLPDETVLEHRIDYLQSKYNYINSQNRKILNDIRLSYDNPLYLDRPNKFNTLNNFSFRVGLSVPLTANNRFRKAEAILDIMEERNELDSKKKENKDRITIAKNELLSAIQHYKFVDSFSEKSLVKSLLENPQTKSNLDPQEWIELLIRDKEYKEEKLKLYENVYRKYISFLKLNGRIVERPFKNYLIRSFPGFAE